MVTLRGKYTLSKNSLSLLLTLIFLLMPAPTDAGTCADVFPARHDAFLPQVGRDTPVGMQKSLVVFVSPEIQNEFSWNPGYFHNLFKGKNIRIEVFSPETPEDLKRLISVYGFTADATAIVAHMNPEGVQWGEKNPLLRREFFSSLDKVSLRGKTIILDGCHSGAEKYVPLADLAEGVHESWKKVAGQRVPRQSRLLEMVLDSTEAHSIIGNRTSTNLSGIHDLNLYLRLFSGKQEPLTPADHEKIRVISRD